MPEAKIIYSFGSSVLNKILLKNKYTQHGNLGEYTQNKSDPSFKVNVSGVQVVRYYLSSLHVAVTEDTECTLPGNLPTGYTRAPGVRVRCALTQFQSQPRQGVQVVWLCNRRNSTGLPKDGAVVLSFQSSALLLNPADPVGPIFH